jgi:hypothetical protein
MRHGKSIYFKNGNRFRECEGNGNGNGNKFRLTTLHNNSGKQATSPARDKMGRHIKYKEVEG